MSSDKNFWNKLAKHYDKMFSRKKAYRKMYDFVKTPLQIGQEVLEVGTGTGLIARQISHKVKKVIATDYSELMIAEAKKIEHAENISFECADVFNLPFADNSFDVVVAANILHIIPKPEKALQEIIRVLKPNGIFIAPTFMWEQVNFLGKIKKFIMLKNNFPIQCKWNKKMYIQFIENNGFTVHKSEIINSSFDICCVQCIKITE